MTEAMGLLEDYAGRFPGEKDKTDLCRDFLENPGSLDGEHARGLFKLDHQRWAAGPLPARGI